MLTTKNKSNFTMKLVVGATTLSIAGLISMYFIINAVVRDISIESLAVIMISFAFIQVIMTVVSVFLMSRITRSIRQHEAKQFVQEIGKDENSLLARMNHEIRTPISVVMGISEFQLQNPNLPSDVKEAFAKINNSSQSLLEIVSGVLGKPETKISAADTAGKERETIAGIHPKFTTEPMPYGRVLVVDDIEANLLVAKGLLGFYKLMVETCNGGQEALDKIKQGVIYDIIFMDQMMPDMSGTETLRAMRTIGYNYPIVALTAGALAGQAEEFIKNGFDGFLSKPIQTQHLNEVLIKHIRGKKSHQVSGAAEIQGSAGIQKSTLEAFVNENHNKANEITNAINSGDLNDAHLVVHSLRSAAALINETALSDAAQIVESLLASGQMPSDSHLTVIETELEQVLGRLKSTLS